MSEFNLFQVYKTEDEIIHTLIENTIKMLGERKMIDERSIDKIINHHKTNITDNLIFTVDLKDNQKCVFMIIRNPVTSMQKTYGINELMSKYKKIHKIIIVKDMSDKTRNTFASNENTEVFLEMELMINIVDNDLVPKHEVVPDDEVDMIYKKYKLRKKDMPRIFTADPIARYYNMKPNQLCRIIRPSETTGEKESFRLVVKKNVL